MVVELGAAHGRVDWERLAGELAREGLFFDKETIEEIPRIFDSLDRRHVAEALAAAGLSMEEEIIDEVIRWLAKNSFKYRAQKTGRTYAAAEPSKRLLNLHDALAEWVSSADDGEACLVDELDDLKIQAVIWLLNATGKAIERLESQKAAVRQEDAKTTFLTGLYRLYLDLGGRPGLSNGEIGPAVRFVRHCAALVNVTVPNGLRQTIQASLKRARGESWDEVQK